MSKELVQKFIRAIASRDIDAAVACVSPDLVNHAAIPTAQGAEGLRVIFGKLWKALPDMTATVDDVICEGDRVVVRMTMRGTNTGPFEMTRFPFPATGKSAVVEHIHIYRVKEGKIVEHWATRDDLGMLRQLGVGPFAQASA